MFRLPFLFIATAMAGFAAFQLASLADLGGWMAADPHVPGGLARAHLFVLGWGTMLAMGAVYQLLTVVLQTELRGQKLGYLHYACFTLGAAGLICGFARFQVEVIAGSAALAFIGFLLFAWNVGSTLVRACKWNPVTVSVAGALGFLLLTGLSGLGMGLDFALGGLGDWHARLFGAHLWLGTLGWFGLLITGFSYKLLPMFYLSHNYPTRLQWVVLGLWSGGVLLGAGAFLCGGAYAWKWSALLLIVGAVYVYGFHMRQIYRHRHKKTPGAGIRYTIGSTIWLGLCGTALLVLGLGWPDRLFRPETMAAAGWMYLWGWVGLMIFGYLSKIAPFLWWTHKYGPLVGKQKTPGMAELIDDRRVTWLLGGVAVTLFLLIVGVTFGWRMLAQAGGDALSLVSLGYLVLVARVFMK